jgi:hypothetical protein
MGLLLKVDSSQNSEGTEVYLEVEEATGLYDADNNDGGFGSPNPARNEIAIVLVAIHKLTSGDVEATVSEYDPLTVTTFTVAISREVNGILQARLYGIPIFDDGGTYEAGAITYNNTDENDPFIQELNEDEEWVELTAAELLSKAGVNEAIKHVFMAPDAVAFRNELNASRTKFNRLKVHGLCGEEEYESARLSYDYVDGELETALNDFCDNAFAEAQKKIDAILEYENTLNA